MIGTADPDDAREQHVARWVKLLCDPKVTGLSPAWAHLWALEQGPCSLGTATGGCHLLPNLLSPTEKEQSGVDEKRIVPGGS